MLVFRTYYGPYTTPHAILFEHNSHGNLAKLSDKTVSSVTISEYRSADNAVFKILSGRIAKVSVYRNSDGQFEIETSQLPQGLGGSSRKSKSARVPVCFGNCPPYSVVCNSGDPSCETGNLICVAKKKTKKATRKTKKK